MRDRQTIFAPASGQGRAGVAVLRISGPEAFAAVRRLAPLPPAREARLRRLRHPDSGEILDHALVILFPAGASFTGEETAELHVHGSPAVVRAVTAVLETMPGLRWAEPGEFTRRALENGRIDLSGAEALADLLAAETEAQRRQAQRNLDGALAGWAETLKTLLIGVSGTIMVSIDFADEDLPPDILQDLTGQLRECQRHLAEQLAGVGFAERVRSGFEVALVGAPNTGKSTLMNRLAGRDVAITSAHAGTTRDVVEVRLELRGLPVTLLDMAGLRASSDPIEAEGIARARKRAEAADLRIVMVEPGAALPEEVALRPDDLVVQAKADLGTDGTGLAVSGLTGAGVDRLVAAIGDRLEARAGHAGLVTNRRQQAAVAAAADALARAQDRLTAGEAALELVQDDVEQAIGHLDVLIGRIDLDGVLESVFSRFCLGK